MEKRILTIGPITKDHIITPTDDYYQIGGAVYYQTMTLTMLKKKVTSIIMIGENDLKILSDTLKKQEIILTPQTQEYTNIYDKNLKRTQKAILPEHQIKPENIKIDTNNTSYALISPLSPKDIPPETIQYLKEKNITTVLVAQGYLRQTDNKNNIIPRKWTDRKKYLEHTDIICLDKDETLQAFNIQDIKQETIQEIIKQYKLKQVIITLAEKGSRIYTEKETIKIPAIPTTQQKDATGLGDTYIAAYISKLNETNDIYLSGLFASITAKEKLKQKGPLKTSIEKIEEELNKYR